MNGNGKPAIPFRSAGNIPIIGQPCEVAGFMGISPVICKCDGARTFLATTTGITPCPGCGKGYIIQSVALQPGQPANVGIGIVPKPQPTGEGQ